MALGNFIQNARDPLYGAGRYQKDPNFDWTQTEMVGGPGGFLEKNPEAIWTRYISGRFGATPTDNSALSQWLRAQEGNVRSSAMAAMAEDPTMTLQRYINSINAQQLLDSYNRLSSEQRGENVSRFAGPSRWLSDL